VRWDEDYRRAPLDGSGIVQLEDLVEDESYRVRVVCESAEEHAVHVCGDLGQQARSGANAT
jgi:hypothetical protein